jgi:hypothetical protein
MVVGYQVHNVSSPAPTKKGLLVIFLTCDIHQRIGVIGRTSLSMLQDESCYNV